MSLYGTESRERGYGLWSVHCNFVRDGNYSERGRACIPKPHQPGLIFPSWQNESQKVAVATLCVLWGANQLEPEATLYIYIWYDKYTVYLRRAFSSGRDLGWTVQLCYHMKKVYSKKSTLPQTAWMDCLQCPHQLKQDHIVLFEVI